MIKQSLYFSLVVLFVFLSFGLSGCGGAVVYPGNPWREVPGIEHIAVAPFIVHESIALEESQQFGYDIFQSNDGRDIFYSIEVADHMAEELMNFPGIRVTTPGRVHDAWKNLEANSAVKANPMASEEQAITLGRSLKADAILVGKIEDWDPYVPRLVLQWELYYTRPRTSNAQEVLEMERQGRLSPQFREKGLIFKEQLSLDKESLETQKYLEIYGEAHEETKPYESAAEAIYSRPYPRFIRFASWVAMRKAYGMKFQ